MRATRPAWRTANSRWPVANEQSSYTLLVEVGGQPLPADVAALLAGGYVDDSLNVPDMFVLRFTDNGSGVLAKGGFVIGAEVRLKVQASGSDGPKPLMSGEVTALETEIDASGVHSVVRGMDKSHRLYRGKRVAAYVQMTATDIASKIAQNNGLQAGRINCPGPVLKHVSQDGLSDWELLRRLGDEVGAQVAVVDGKLDFCTPTDAAAAPSAQQGSTQNTLVIERGANLVSLRATVTAADQVPEVEVRGWDVEAKRALVAVSQPSTRSAKLAGVRPADLARTVGSQKWIESVSGYGTQRQCDTMAGALADRFAGSFAELDGVVRGNPDMRAGKAVALSNVGDPFNGSYTLTSTHHEFSPEFGYQTAFSVSNVSDRSLYGVAAGARSQAGAVTGVLSATVTDVKDPDKLGRVKISFPVMSDSYTSWWARTVQLGAGDGRGTVVLPEVGDEVLVAFGMGNFDEPYVLGGLYNGVDKPATPWGDHIGSTDGSVQRRAFVSRTGMVVEMIETPQEQKLTLSTNDGQQRVTLVQKSDAEIEIVASGPVKVTAQKDVTVSSTGGNVSVSGTDITLAATNALKLSGASVQIDSQTTAALKAGASVKVSADGAAELSAAGTTTVKGAMVMIN
jgi:uncharacterized protein involved in type VI secretion and phage assembly